VLSEHRPWYDGFAFQERKVTERNTSLFSRSTIMTIADLHRAGGKAEPVLPGWRLAPDQVFAGSPRPNPARGRGVI
jgi:hypothetical protein